MDASQLSASVIAQKTRPDWITLMIGPEKAARLATPNEAATRPATSGMLRRFALQGYQLIRPAARLLIPLPLRTRLGGLVSRLERLTSESIEESFRKRQIPLALLPPVLPARAFGGGTVLVNNALAWGGVERQVVYTLLGIDPRAPEGSGLLCLRLGVDANHDFYRSALAEYQGFVRNVMIADEALALLDTQLSLEQRSMIETSIGWLPSDAKQEIWRFLAEFLRLQPAVVHIWQDALSITAGFAARIAGVPRIIVSGRNVAPIHFGYHRAYMKCAYAELASCPNVVMLNNSEAGIRSYAAWIGLPEDRFNVLRNGIDPATIASPDPASVEALRVELGIPAEAPVVGSIFRLYDEKQPLLWARTAAAVARKRPDAHFVIFGTGPLRDQVLKLVKKHGIENRFHLPGTIGDPALGLGLFNVFLLTSKFEGTPNVVLEASLMGIPVVATDAGGTAETIEEAVTGFIVGSGLADDLGAHIVRILDDPDFIARAKENGRRFVLGRFGLERMIEETLSLHRGGH